MSRFLIQAGSAAFALTLLSFAGAATAAPRPALDGVTGLMILTGDEENAEVQNLLDPEADNGAPKDNTGAAVPPPPEGEHAAAPPHEEGEHAAVPPHEEGEHAAVPHEGGESGERALESTVGGDGINAIQRESIPEKNDY
jgi:hypothetical protein